MVRPLLMVIALVGAAFAAWPQPSHPLAYFRVDPCVRPESDPLRKSLGCTPSPAEEKRRAATKTELTQVGRIGKWIIYDLWYSRAMEDSPGGDPSLRSVLVETEPGRYREIDVQVRHGTVFPPSEIVDLDGEPILIAKSHDGGNHNRIDEALYMFRPSGLEKPDFKAVQEAVHRLLPPKMSIRTWTHDYGSRTELVEAYRNDLNLPPVEVIERCRISVTYRFVTGHAVVTGSKYEPTSNP